MDPRIKEMDDNKVAEALKDSSKLHFIGTMIPSRFGVHLFATLLEYTFFKPNTEMNKLYELHLIKWGTDKFDIIWSVVSVPQEYKVHTDVCLDKSYLKAVRAVPSIIETPIGGTTVPVTVAVSKPELLKTHPLFMNAISIKTWPYDGPTVFTMEHDNSENLAYKNSKTHNMLLDIESQICRKIHESTDGMVDPDIIKRETDEINRILKRK